MKDDGQNWLRMPGPEPDPEFGNLPAIHLAGDLARFQIDMHKQYKDIFLAYLAQDKPVVFINSAKYIKKLSTVKQKPGYLYDFLKPLVGESFHLNDSDTQKVRGLVLKHFSKQLVSENFVTLSRIIDDDIKQWVLGRDDYQTIDVQIKLKSLSMKLAIFLIFGEELNSVETKTLASAFHHSLEHARAIQYGRNSSDFQKSKEKLATNLVCVNQKIKQLINRWQARKTAPEKTSFYGALKEVSDSIEKVNEQDLTKFIMMAAYHTIASTVAWMLYSYAYELSTDDQRNLAGEIAEVNMTPDSIGKINFPNLDSFLKEVMRKYTPGPYTARELVQETMLGEYVLPKGCVVFFSLWSMHMDKKNYSNPALFSSNRFQKGNNSNMKFSHCPFGVGSRNCSGQIMANLLIPLIFSRIVKSCKLQKSKDEFKPKIVENFVLISENGIKLKIAARASELELAQVDQNIPSNRRAVQNNYPHFAGLFLLSSLSAVLFSLGMNKLAGFFFLVVIASIVKPETNIIGKVLSLLFSNEQVSAKSHEPEAVKVASFK